MIAQLVLIVFGFALLVYPALRHCTGRRSEPLRPSTRSCSRSRSRCSRSRASRPWRTSPRRRAGPGSTCRGRCSPRSARSSPSTWRSLSSGSRPSPGPRHGARHHVAPLAARRRSPTRSVPQTNSTPRRRDPVLRRRERRADPHRVGDDVDVGLLPSRLLPRRARPAAAGLRASQPPHARLALRDRQRRRSSRARS